MQKEYSLGNTTDVLMTAAFAINDKIKNDFGSLSTNEILTLNEQARSLLFQARTLQELATIEIAESVIKELNSLKDATERIESAIKTIKNVQKIIDITAKVVVLASSILSENYAAIPGNVKDIILAIQ